MSRESTHLWSCILEKTSAQEESSNSGRSEGKKYRYSILQVGLASEDQFYLKIRSLSRSNFCNFKGLGCLLL